MPEGERTEQHLEQTGKPDLVALRHDLPLLIVDVGQKLGAERGRDSLYPAGNYGYTPLDASSFYQDVFTEIRLAAEKSGRSEEFTTLPEMPVVERQVQEGIITPKDAELYKKRLVSLLGLEPVLANPGYLGEEVNSILGGGVEALSGLTDKLMERGNITPEDAERYKKAFSSLHDLEPILTRGMQVSEDDTLRLRTGFLALSHRIASQYALYPPDELKDASPEFLIALARKNLASEIAAKGEYVQNQELKPDTWPIDYALTPEEADALELRFPDTYRADGYLRKAAAVFKDNQIVLRGNIRNRGDIAYAAYRYKQQGGQPDRNTFLQSLGYTPEDMNALTQQAQQTVDSLLGEEK